jgi:hypothetical protein
MRYKELFAWMRERHSIYTKRAAGKPKPWTKDPILQQYRFCNVYRELDTVTQWINDNWRITGINDPHLWFSMVVARLVNRPDTLDELTYNMFDMGKTGVTKWDAKEFLNDMRSRKAAGLKVFSGAYIVSTNGHAMDKAEYLAEHVLTPLWKARKGIAPRHGDTLDRFHKRLMQHQGMGSFMAAQVVADMKYVEPLLSATDWRYWAASGPGSRRGLNWVCGFDPQSGWPENLWLDTMILLKEKIDPLVEKAGMPSLHMQDLQNCLCELFKYVKVVEGLGKPRSNYPGV